MHKNHGSVVRARMTRRVLIVAPLLMVAMFIMLQYTVLTGLSDVPLTDAAEHDQPQQKQQQQHPPDAGNPPPAPPAPRDANSPGDDALSPGDDHPGVPSGGERVDRAVETPVGVEGALPAAQVDAKTYAWQNHDQRDPSRWLSLEAQRTRAAQVSALTVRTTCRTPSTRRSFIEDPILVVSSGNPNFSGVPKRTKFRCDVPCFYASRWSGLVHSIDAFLNMHLQGGGAFPPDHTCGMQKRVILSQESPKTYPFIASYEHAAEHFHGRVDYLMNVELQSDVPVGYYSWVEYDMMLAPQNKDAASPAAAFVSNCDNSGGRYGYLSSLIKQHPSLVHSYGRCLRNRQEGGRRRKHELLQSYYFSLAFENTVHTDYVTEKYWQSVVAGTVPVVRGAPNIKEYEPWPGAVVDINDFESSDALGAHLSALMNDPARYNALLAWKQTGPQDSFYALVDIAAVHSQCRLCLRLADDHTRPHAPTMAHRVPRTGSPLDHLEIALPSHPDFAPGALLVRERNTFFFRPVWLARPSLSALHDAIHDAFFAPTSASGGEEDTAYQPVWHTERKPAHGSSPTLYRIIPAYGSMRDSLFGPHFDSDALVARLPVGARLEVIFI